MRKIEPVQPLSAGDPIWRLIGAGVGGREDVSANHDKYLAAEETRLPLISTPICG